MWVIVAMSVAFGDTPKVTVLPGPEFQSREDCLRAVHIHADVHSDQGAVNFSFCVPKDSVQIGAATPPADKHD